MRLEIERATDLGSVLDTTVGDSEGVDCPVQVESMLRFPERQSFPQGSLINLNNVNACLLKILDFVLDGQSNLVAGFMSAKLAAIYIKQCFHFKRLTNSEPVLIYIPGLVISDKGPVENGDRASKHSLHWASSHALSQGGPEDGHSLGTAHVTIDDGWLHTARSIGLHPTIGSEGET